jgi:hypothetical protein
MRFGGSLASEFEPFLGNLGGISAIISPVSFLHSEFCTNNDFAVFI